MKATTLLRDEHAVILRALACLDTLATRAAEGQPVPQRSVAAAAEFLTEFADRHHHRKEEDILFPALIAAGFPAKAGPVAVMLNEHEQGRSLIRALRAAASHPDASFAQAARAYAALLRQHIHKENEVLFRMADQVIQGPVRERVDAEVDRFEKTAGALRANQEAAIVRLEAELN